MELRMQKIHDPDKTWAVRVCMAVDAAQVHTEHSVIKQCEECGVDVWYDPTQVIPTIVGVVFEGEVILCVRCMLLHESQDPEPAKWMGPNPWA